MDANIYFYCYFNFEWTRLFRLLTFTLSSLLFQLINLYARMKHLSLWSPACVWMGPLEWAYWAIRSVSVYNLQLKLFSLWKTHQHEAIKAIASCHIPFVQDGKTFLETFPEEMCFVWSTIYSTRNLCKDCDNKDVLNCRHTQNCTFCHHFLTVKSFLNTKEDILKIVFGTTRSWVNDARIFIFGWTISLNGLIGIRSCFADKVTTLV